MSNPQSFHKHPNPPMDIKLNREELQILRDALREYRFGDYRFSRDDARYQLQQRLEKCLWFGGGQ